MTLMAQYSPPPPLMSCVGRARHVSISPHAHPLAGGNFFLGIQVDHDHRRRSENATVIKMRMPRGQRKRCSGTFNTGECTWGGIDVAPDQMTMRDMCYNFPHTGSVRADRDAHMGSLYLCLFRHRPTRKCEISRNVERHAVGKGITRL